jgi:cytochrome c oxidase subunit 1
MGSMIHGLTVPGAIEAAQPRNGFTNGVFEWLRKAPWSHPAFSGMFLSLVFFGFIGGISGVVLGTEQLNLLMHNTIYVPGHFHGTVVAGTTLAFIAATYLVLPLIFEREIIWPKLARLQPYLFGIGAAGMEQAERDGLDAALADRLDNWFSRHFETHDARLHHALGSHH